MKDKFLGNQDLRRQIKVTILHHNMSGSNIIFFSKRWH